MKIGEIIAKIGELIAAVEIADEGNLNLAPATAPVVVAPQPVEDNRPSPNGTTASGNDREPEELFLPPLQQKQELLKKAVGVDNVYDDGRPDEQHEKEKELEEVKAEQQRIVNRIKQLSGIPVAAIQELSNDDIVDD
jgi:hypothetical protein